MKVKIEGLDCPHCAQKLEKAINGLESVESAEINFLKSEINFKSKKEDKAINDIIALTKIIEPDARIYLNPADKKKIARKNLIVDCVMVCVGLVLGLLSLVIESPVWLYWILLLSGTLIIGHKTFFKAIMQLSKGVVNENLLITISLFGAIAVGEKFEGLMIIALFSIGKILEEIALNKSRRAIDEISNFKPEIAYVLRDGKEVKISPEDAQVGETLIVKAGERISCDGVVISGLCNLNMQNLTGESVPVFVQKGMDVPSGAIVLDGELKIKISKPYEEGTVSTIIKLIETASEKKSKTETFISKIMKWYTLAVISLAVLVWGIVWFAIGDFETALYRGLTFLVVACPCAFAISVPLAYFCGIGNASKNGILVKGANYLDACAKLNSVAFNKTTLLNNANFTGISNGDLNNNSQLKESSKNACLNLAKLGVETSILSGDSKEVDADLMQDFGAKNVHNEMLSQEKYDWIMAQKKAGKKIGYVGDGLNDAPPLKLADVGFCMGVEGHLATVEASDIILANNDPQKIAQAIKISKYTRSIVWQNIVFSLVIKIAILALGAFGVTGMLFAVIGDVGVTLLAILNSLRALTHANKKFKEVDKNL